ncbi:hypothetical protein H6758_02505 [Candidatus Nomurabacteria bacterium]|nr:hypothetical protein [Candidatus Nomurabacteria bacterium]
MDRMPNFLRKLSPAMLNAYCKHKNIDFTVSPKEKDTEKIKQSFIECWEKLEYTERNEVEIDFGATEELMSNTGCGLLHDLAVQKKKTIPKEWDNMTTADKALWFYLNDPETFREGALRYVVENAQGWMTFRADAELPTADLDARVGKLQQQMQKYLYAKERRGALCKIDMIQKDNYVCFVANPQNYPKREPEYDEKTKELNKATSIKPIYQLYFLYRSDDQTLSIKSRYRKNKKQDLANMFGNHVLNVPLLGDKIISYNLDLLLDPEFEMKKPLGLEKVVLKRVRLKSRRNFKHSIQLDLGTLDDGIEPLREQLRLYNINPTFFEVATATMTFYFQRPKDPRYKNQRFDVTVELSKPHRCTFKNRDLDDKARTVLHDWGIVN